MEKYYITTAISYTSGKPHIGNTYEVVLADAIASLERWGNWSAYYPWADEIYSLSYLI